MCCLKPSFITIGRFVSFLFTRRSFFTVEASETNLQGGRKRLAWCVFYLTIPEILRIIAQPQNATKNDLKKLHSSGPGRSSCTAAHKNRATCHAFVAQESAGKSRMKRISAAPPVHKKLRARVEGHGVIAAAAGV